ncbi:MAG: hypothetical protein WA807_14490 [Steroidobacteraceae bacterium]
MTDRNADGDAAARLLERRWFATIAAARAMHAECEALREIAVLAADSWRRARDQLARLEALRDALCEELVDAEGRRQPSHSPAKIEREMSPAA